MEPQTGRPARTARGAAGLPQIDEIADYMAGARQNLIAEYEAVDGGKFRRDEWAWRDGGGGLTCVLEDGRVFERACVGFSRVTGRRLPAAASGRHPALAGKAFEVAGVSTIVHPRNPYAPTGHMNVRFFSSLGEEPRWWFGGCMDLTPCYGFEEDARHFHSVCREAVAPFGADHHSRFKKQCDDYFFLKHRSEARGIGGIFFDDLDEPSFEACFALARSVADRFLSAYLPLVERRSTTPYGKRERDFQAWRRGRYAEFNLAQDRGTAFGLQLGGRAESILASLPPTALWRYDWKPEAGSPEEKLLTEFLKPKDWLAREPSPPK